MAAAEERGIKISYDIHIDPIRPGLKRTIYEYKIYRRSTGIDGLNTIVYVGKGKAQSEEEAFHFAKVMIRQEAIQPDVLPAPRKPAAKKKSTPKTADAKKPAAKKETEDAKE